MQELLQVEVDGKPHPLLVSCNLKELSHQIRSSTGEEKAHFYLSQRLSVAIQKGNSASIIGTIGPMTMDDLLE